MASFSLRSQRTGQYHEFSLLEILKLLGDQVNDEIWLKNGEDVFNLSSFRELNGGGTGGGSPQEFWMTESVTNANGQNTFNLSYTPSGKVLLIILNGIVLSLNRDFSRNGKQIMLPFQLNTQDTLQFIYQY